MIQENKQNKITATEYISQKEYYEIKQLESICQFKDQTNLKLELDYKLYISNAAREKSESLGDQSGNNDTEVKKQQTNSLSTNKLNEFLYYIEDTLVAYIGISSFGRNIGEINGMTHPDWRRKGIFHKLFNQVTKECQRRDFSKVLLLSDGNSESGIAFIQSVGGIYDFSEYRMKLIQYPDFDETSSINLRIAKKRDKKKIAGLNTIFFDDDEELDENQKDIENNNTKNIDCEVSNEVTPEEEPMDGDPNTTIYMIEFTGEVIGKIHVDYSDNTAFICGFGILPDYRGKGYGKAALKEALRIIAEKNLTEVGLDVACTNSKALNLYIGCGFEQQSIMNYYRSNSN